ncbi:MAG: hypothetical protein ACOVNY_11020 [Chitinophagaceae bacterium]
MRRRLTTLVLIGILLSHFVWAQQNHAIENEYQFHTLVPYKNSKDESKQVTAYLWIPNQCNKVQGVIIAAQNVLEQWLLEHPLVRKACAKSNLAIVWSCPSFFVDGKTHYPEINVPTIQRILDSLAFISGYEELKRVPWLPIGHSGTNNLVAALIDSVPNKLIAGIKMKGGPGFSNASVPVMCNAGEYFEWNQHKEDLVNPKTNIPNYKNVLSERKQKNNPLTYFFDPNTGHFECSEQLTKLVADYIEAVSKARLNPNNDTLLNTVDLNKGWVAGLPLPGAVKLEPTLYKNALGDEKYFPWYFTKQQATDAIQLSSVNFNRKPQIAAFANDQGEPVGFTRGIVWPIPYTTVDDGVTFNLNATFLKAIPDTFLQKGTPLGHNNNQPQIILLCGNAKHIKGNTFQLTPERSFKASATYFIIRQEGDAKYRTCIEPGQLVVMPNDKGLVQQINFTPLKNITATTKQIQLQATSTSGMPVSFFVKSGPAKIENNHLIIKAIPPKTKFPVKVTVIAYQWGRSKEPAIQTTQEVERFFYIKR